jgi:hypothetical protein
MDDLERRRRRQQGARFLIRAELAFALAVPLIAGFLYIAGPGDIGPMFREPPFFTSLIPCIGVAGYVVGITWMIRLSRTNPEAGESSWRYRDF